MTGLTLAICAYVAVQLAVGFWISRRVHNEVDYLLAGRQLGLLMSVFTVFATWFGAETCIGAAGRAYSKGLSGNTSDPFGYAVALVLVGALLAVPLYRRRLVTLADLFRARYSITAERLAVLLMVPTSLMWAAAQIRAFGQVLDAASGLGVSITISIAAAVVILYTTTGGMLADAYTDLIQGFVLIAGLVTVGVMLWVSGDASALGSIPVSRLAPAAPGQSAFDIIEAWAIPICGSLVAQELIARVLSARNPGIARRAPVIAGFGYLAVGLIPVTVGLVAFVTLPGLAEPEQVLIVTAERLLPTWLYVVFAGALVSAILSTVDSALLVAGSLVAHNLVAPLRPNLSGARLLSVNRVCVFGFGVAAYVLALHAKGVYALVEEASAFGTSGILVATLFGLFSRRGGSIAAMAGLVTGVVVYAGGSHLIEIPHPYVTSLAAAALLFFFGSLVDSRRRPCSRDRGDEP